MTAMLPFSGDDACDQAATGHRRGIQARRVIAVLLAAVFALAVPLAVTGAWVRQTVISTDGYVAAVTPIAASPVVAAAVRDAVVSQVGPLVKQAATRALPARVSFLAGPLSDGAERLAGAAVTRVLATSVFQKAWVAANRSAHSQLIAVLNGDSSVVATTNGEVVISVVPLINLVLKDVAGRLSSLTGKTVTAPVVSQVPGAACQQIARATHAALSTDCGQIPVFAAAALAGPRHMFRLLNVGTLALLIGTPLIGAAAVLVAPRRRRTLAWMAVASALTVLVAANAVGLLQSRLIGRTARYEAVVSVIVHALTHGFFVLAGWEVIGLLAAGAAAFLLGLRRARGSGPEVTELT